MKAPLLCLLLLAGVGACRATKPANAALASDVSGWPLFGAELGPVEPIELEALLDGAGANDGRAFVVQGTVESVCARKGCWMVLADGERSMRVTFKDYGFFVPTDIAGRRVRCEGVFAVEEVPVDEARHYLEDEGRHAEAALVTEPQREFVFEATGVRVAAQ